MHNNKTASKRAQAVPNQIKQIKKKTEKRLFVPFLLFCVTSLVVCAKTGSYLNDAPGVRSA